MVLLLGASQGSAVLWTVGIVLLIAGTGPLAGRRRYW
jgi:hypothetical protein